MTLPVVSRRAVGVSLLGFGLAACVTTEGEAAIGAILGQTGVLGPVGGLSQADAAAGVRAALEAGTAAAVATVSRTDGYWRDDIIKIPLPGFLGDLQQSLGRLGLSGALDDLELGLNRAAENAASQAAPIFIDAIRGMTIEDALGIVRGGSTSATDFFEARTRAPLAALFTPPMTAALERSGAIAAFDQLVGQLKAVPFAPQLGADAKGDLIVHGVGRGLDGLFHYVGQEEAAIRRDPAKRTSDILRRVFA